MKLTNNYCRRVEIMDGLGWTMKSTHNSSPSNFVMEKVGGRFLVESVRTNFRIVFQYRHSTIISILASRPSWPEFYSQGSQNFLRGKNIAVVVVSQLCWSEESGQWLENVDQTHLVLDCGKLVLQKHILPWYYFAKSCYSICDSIVYSLVVIEFL